MAKGSLFLGQSRGKIGTVVNYVQGGEQRTRVYTAAGGRPGDRATLPARMQRVAFGAASTQWRLFSWVCTRMYRRGKKTKESDFNYFTRINFPNLPYNSKATNLVGGNCPMPGIFSTGTYGTLYQSLVCNQSSLSAADAVWSIKGVGDYDIEKIKWTDKVSKWKSAYQAAFPDATKITIPYTKWEIYDDVIGGVSGDIMEFDWRAIILDLQKERYLGENDMTVTEYLQQYTDLPIKVVEEDPIDSVCSVEELFRFKSELVTGSRYNGMFMLFFATNDNANDCYTTILTSNKSTEDWSPLRYWLSRKTKEAMEAACESYGYTEGVMQTDIVEVGQAVEEIIAADAALSAEEHHISSEKLDEFRKSYRKNVLNNIALDVKKLAEQVAANKEALAALEEQKKKAKEEKKK